MDVPIGELCLGQLVVQPHPPGQGLGHILGTGGHRLLGEGAQQVVGDPRRQGVDGDDAAGEVLLSHPLEDGVDHGAAAALLLHHAVKDIFLSGPEGPLHIALVEEGDVQGPRLVHHFQLHQVQPLADAGEAGVLRRHGGDAHLLAQGCGADGVHLPPVLIVPWKVGNQVGAPDQAKLLQLLGPHFAHAGKLREGGIQRDLHGLRLLSAVCAAGINRFAVCSAATIVAQVFFMVKGREASNSPAELKPLPECGILKSSPQGSNTHSIKLYRKEVVFDA